MQARRPPIIVILGPTASGKSDLGVRLARRFRGVVVSADSRQVYRGYDLGSGKVTERERRGVPHFLLDVASLRRRYTAADFARDFQRVVGRLDSTTSVFLVGGSPFYLEAALHPERLSGVSPDAKLRARLEQRTTRALLRELERRAPERAARIDRRNRRRIIRAIEVARGTSRRRARQAADGPRRVLILGVTHPRAELYARIDRRVDARLRRGMLAEIRRLHERGVSWRRLESLGLEARFLSYALRGTVPKTVAIERLKGAIHAFARRQLTWWRRDRSIHWVRSARHAEQLCRDFLAQPN